MIGGGGGVDVDVLVEESVEHGAGFAGLDVEDQLAVLVGGVHGVDGLKCCIKLSKRVTY